METENKVLIERERCKAIIIKKIESVIEYRNKKIKHIKRRSISYYEKLKEDILFLIDNPDYVRIKDRI